LGTKAAQIIAALCYLHSQRIVHGDIKAVRQSPCPFLSILKCPKANVVTSDSGEALLIDFGSSFDLDGTEPMTLNEIGTCRWMAPELINPGSKEEDENDRERLYLATDIWAYAMTILEVHTSSVFSLI
jgi:serine/threonine protein kinase